MLTRQIYTSGIKIRPFTALFLKINTNSLFPRLDATIAPKGQLMAFFVCFSKHHPLAYMDLFIRATFQPYYFAVPFITENQSVA